MTCPTTPSGGETTTVHAALQVSGTGWILAVGDPSDASRTCLHRLEPLRRWTGCPRSRCGSPRPGWRTGAPSCRGRRRRGRRTPDTRAARRGPRGTREGRVTGRRHGSPRTAAPFARMGHAPRNVAPPERGTLVTGPAQAGGPNRTGPRSGPPRDGGGRTRAGRRIRGRWDWRRAGAGGPAPPRPRGFPGTGARPSRRRGGPRPAGQRPPPSREGARTLPGAAGMPRPAALPAAPRAAPDPAGRLWGVMHRHVRRDRLHADPRRFTGTILRFPDGVLPREREAIAESVTGGFRVVTHDGYRMAG